MIMRLVNALPASSISHRIKSSCFLVTLFTLLFAHSVSAGGFSVFGPTDFERSTGAPVEEVVNFSVPQAGSYTLTLYNGGLEDAQFELVSSSIITVNGEEVFTTNQFNQQTDILEATVQLELDNIVTVELRGKPGGGITLNIEGNDDTAPVISATLSAQANAAGWHNQDVTISYSCTDDFSGVISCPAPIEVSSEGANQSFTATVSDVAGNETQLTTLISLDKTAPTLSATFSEPANEFGWHKDDLIISYQCSDSISSVESCPTDVPVTTEGAAQEFIAQITDLAGNQASVSSIVSLDKTAPTITATLSVPANEAGWHKNDVTVSYVCTDNLVTLSACPDPQVVATEGAEQSILASVADLAGNQTDVMTVVSLDKTPPTITATLSVPANEAGWHKNDVTITYACADNLVSLEQCPVPVTVSNEGAAQEFPATVADLAGNVAEVSSTISLDKTPPEIVVPDEVLVIETEPVAIEIGTATATDNLTETPAITNDAPESFPFGETLVEWTATDLAGNSVSADQEVVLTSAPVISSLPPVQAQIGVPYVYQVIATDPNGDELSYLLGAFPNGMTIDEVTGEVSWLPSADQAPEVTINVVVKDIYGATVTQEFVVAIASGERPISHEGQDFWFTPSTNFINGSSRDIQIYLASNENDAEVQFEFPKTQEFETIQVPAGELVTYTLTNTRLNQIQLFRYGHDVQGSVHITSDQNITVYATNLVQYSSDGFLVYPTHALGTDYMMASHVGAAIGRMTVIATEDNTDVTFNGIMDLNVNSQNEVALKGVDYTVSLNRGDVFRFQTFNSGKADHTGSTIASSKPIAVYGEVGCAQVPSGSDFCDHIVEQLPPLSSLSDEYFLAPLEQKFGYSVRVVAPYDGTQVYINDALYSHLDRGEFSEFVAYGGTKIETSQPSLVMQYANGSAFDYIIHGAQENFGDPFMSLVAPKEQYLTRYQLSAPSIGYHTQYIGIIAPSEAIGSIELDGVLVSASEFTQIHNADMYYANIPVDPGTYSLRGQHPFGAQMYGWGSDDSYGYIGGLAFSGDAQVGSVFLGAEPDSSVGESHCSVATVEDVSGNALWGVRVHFAVAGIRALSDFVLTDSQGQAEFCYQGLEQGQESVSATVSGVSDSVAVNWIANASGVNFAPVITSVPTNLALNDGDFFSYQLESWDIENDELSYALLEAPSGMSVGETGLLSWTADGLAESIHHLSSISDGHIWPATDLSLTFPVTVAVTDSVGGTTSQSFIIRQYIEFNHPPVIDVNPPPVAKQSKPYHIWPEHGNPIHRATILTSDADRDGDKVYIKEGPAGASIFYTPIGRGWYSRLVWSPQEAGEANFVLEARDVRGATSEYAFTVQVEPNYEPVVTTTPLSLAAVGSLYEYIPVVEDDTRDGNFIASNYTVVQAPTGMTTDNTFGPEGFVIRKLLWTPTANQVGTHTVRLEFRDEINTTVQEFTIEVTDSQPPVINSTAGLHADVSRPYTYQLDVSDPDDSDFNFTLEVAPDGMTVDENGLVSWIPTPAQQGSHTVWILVDDTRGGYARERYSLSVQVGVNTAPEIVSNPVIAAAIGFPYTYTVAANDAENDILTYSLQTGPAGMSIDSESGQISWTPVAGQLGDNSVTVQVSDFALSDQQSFVVAVSEDPLPLTATVSVDPKTINQGETSLVSVGVSGGQGPATIQATVNGTPLALDSSNQAVVTGDSIGIYQIDVSVSDGVDTVEASEFFTVIDPNDTTPPVVSIDSPLDGASITSLTDIIGSVTETNLAEYRVSIAPSRSGQFTTIATGSSEQANAVLAVFDPTLHVNGQFDVLLEAVDFNGQTGQATTSVLVEGDLKVGNFSFTLLDLEIPMAGIPIRVTRTYDSRRRHEPLDFGYGWSVGYQDLKLQESRTPGAGWESYTVQSGPLNSITNFCLRPLGNMTVSVTLPDGDVERFVPKAIPECNQSSPTAPVNLGFDPVGDTQSTLTLQANISLQLQGDSLILAGNPGAYDPDFYRLTTRNGLAYSITQGEGVTRIDEPNGNFLTFGTFGIVHSTGASVDFVRDINNRITSITDPAGNVINYFYNSSDDLIEAQDKASTEAGEVGSTYTYNSEHGLVDMFDPLGRRLVKNIYDAAGRLIAQEDENGVRTEFNHDLAGQQSIVTDRRGNTTVFYYDERGNVTSQVDALNGVSTFTYDANGNQLSQTDPLNNTSSATFNASNDQLSQTDAEGNTVSFTYNDRGDELTIEDARGNVFENTYDSFGNLLTVEDPLGNVAGNNINAQGLVSLTQDALGNTTSFTYDDNGNKLTETDAEGFTTTYTYDDNGNVLTESRDRLVGGVSVTETTTFEYDAMNRVVRTIDAEGSVTDTVYDGAGNQIATLDPLGRVTEYEYDAYGRLTRTLYPDTTEELRSYDAEGNLIGETDRLGRVTTFAYDALNRLTRTTFDDGSFTETEYDAAGRVIAEIDERGNRTEHGYDAAGRRTSTTDALLNVTSFTYDEDGNLLTQTDANGHTTSYVYNALDQRIETHFHDGTSLLESYDALGRLLSRTDQAGKTTSYEYDNLGRLTAVVDALNQRTEYGYDEAGNKISQIDANLNETTWTYDAVGRVLSRTLPMGQSESFTYDANGNQLTRTDFNGDTTTYGYDVNDRLVSVSYSDGTTEAYTYDAVGNRLTVTDASGTTSYQYDNRNRLILETKPTGATLAYDYDNAGNRTSLTTTMPTNAGPIVLLETQTFDALNRLESSTDSGSNTTVYAYDNVGNRAAISHPNGNTTQYTYDSLNRLTDISVFNGLSVLVDQFAYTLGDSGRREVITELSGRTSTYVYDDLYRLTSESIVDASLGNHTASYVYDPVGNRSSSVINGVSTSYSYDDNDRLTSAGGDSYNYDANGNTLSRTEGGVTTSFVYDKRNRMVSSTSGGVTTSYGYNADGIRTERSSGGSTTEFVVDHNRDYAQVVAEITDGDFVVGYSFGDDLISQVFPGGSVFFYHYDGLGSTRSLSDATGLFTDEYDYEAFGELTGTSGSTANSYLFAGEQFDSGLGDYYLRARYYSQGIGRFMQMDTFQGLMDDPVTLHKYLYANADPIRNVDPSGQISLNSITQALQVSARLVTTSVRAVGSSAVRFAKTARNFSSRTVDAGKTVLIRVQYQNRVRELSRLAKELRSSGKSSEEIAKILNTKRRALGRLFKNATDATTRQNAYARNLSRYGDKYGPTWQYLRSQGKSWDDIIESAARPNSSFQELVKIFFGR
jgi:RHS repeat-associated protein